LRHYRDWLQEYEDLAIELLRNSVKREALRLEIKRLRTQSRLFHTRHWTDEFTKALQGVWEQFKANSNAQRGPLPSLSTADLRAWHKEGSPRATPHSHQFSTDPPLSAGVVDTPLLQDGDFAQPGLLSFFTDEMIKIFHAAGQHILLNIGGISARPGWINVNAQAGPGIHLQAHMSEMSMFPDDTVTAIYSSHTFEHIPYFTNVSALTTLKEWYRVLRPGGRLMVAVPDMRVLAKAILDDSLDLQDRFQLMKMVFGAQTDDYDFHYAGYDLELLSSFLRSAGFCEIEKVDTFGLFSDTSTISFRGYNISLNVMAKACNKSGVEVSVAIPSARKQQQ
jgi:predicted SAM-dependent methyltransferase